MSKFLLIQSDAVQTVVDTAANALAAPEKITIWDLTMNEQSMNPPIGTPFKEGDTMCYVIAYYGNDPVTALFSGKLMHVFAKQGEKVKKGDIVALIQ